MYTAEPENDSRDQFMHIESDGSEKHQNSNTYVSKQKESSFTHHPNLSSTSLNHKPSLIHSNSNNRLRYRVDLRNSPRKYTRDNMLSTSSHLTRHYNIIKPSAKQDLQLTYRQQSSKSSYEHPQHHQQHSQHSQHHQHEHEQTTNLTERVGLKTLGYNAKPVVRRRHDPAFSKIADKKRYNDYFKPDDL